MQIDKWFGREMMMMLILVVPVESRRFEEEGSEEAKDTSLNIKEKGTGRIYSLLII